MKPIACELDDITERIRFAIEQEYGSPDEETLYDPEEGDYAGNVMENFEVFEDIGFDVENDQLREDIVSCFSDERFCRKGMWAGSLSERQMEAWDGFKQIIKHHRRYTFWSIPRTTVNTVLLSTIQVKCLPISLKQFHVLVLRPNYRSRVGFGGFGFMKLPNPSCCRKSLQHPT